MSRRGTPGGSCGNERPDGRDRVVETVVQRGAGADDDRHLAPDRNVEPLGQLGSAAAGDLLEALRQLPAHGDAPGRVDCGRGPRATRQGAWATRTRRPRTATDASSCQSASSSAARRGR